MHPRILILSASTGTGHIRAAEALQQAFAQIRFAGDVRHEDALSYTNAAFRSLYSQTYLDLVNSAPEILGWLYDFLDSPWKNEKHRLAFESLNAGPLIDLLEEYSPDVVISTHFLPADMLSWLICRRRITCQHAIVLTDFDLHAMWLCHHYSLFFVALDETKEHMRRLGFESDRIVVSGIPVHPKFALRNDKQAMRVKHGLRPDLKTVLVSAGGFGVGPVHYLLKSLAGINRYQIVVVCGHNDELKSELDIAIAHSPDEFSSWTVLGYTKDMDELMDAADVIVGKPGGLTSAEAMVKGLAFVIVNPIPGQEERNADHLIEGGAAIRCNNLPALPYKLNALLESPQRLRNLQRNAEQFAMPDAALDIARKVEELTRQAACTPLAISPSGHTCLSRPERALQKAKDVATQILRLGTNRGPESHSFGEA